MQIAPMNTPATNGDQPRGDKNLIDAAWSQVEPILAGRESSFGASGPEAAFTSPLPSGAFAGYRILGEIHRGGQGVVYMALQESTRRKVAIKVLKDGPFAGPADLARFDREIDLLSRLRHPSIVSIHDRGRAAGHSYYVMDFVPGRSLDDFVAQQDLGLEATLRLFQ